ncbi:MAG: hypothetical protein WC196_05100 [Bacilli bacterium]|jgi:hypothetical protein
MFIELAEKIFSEDGIIALVLIAVLMILGLMVYVLLQLVKQKSSSEQTVITQAEIIAQLVSPIKEITDQLKITGESLVKVVEMMEGHDTRVTNMRTMLDDAVKKMSDSAEERRTQVETIPERVRKEVATDVDNIITRKVDALTKDIKDLIQALDEKLSNRIDELPNKTVEVMRQELAELSTLIDKSLREVAETAKSVSEE